MNAFKRTFGFIWNHPLAGKHLIRSFSRWIWWQIQTTTSSSNYIVKPFVGPVKFYATKGLTGITGNIYTGFHEFNDMLFLLHFLRKGDLFVDLGANVGSYTLLASGWCNANSIAVEPVKKTFDVLSRNVSLNRIDELVELVNAAVGAGQGMVTFTSDQDTTNHVLAGNESPAQNNVLVPMVTVDSLTNLKYLTLIKVDVEGFETEVLAGMRNTLSSAVLKAVIIELNGSGGRYGFDEQKIHELLLTNQFLPYHYDPFTRELTPKPTHGDYNTIYCRDVNFIKERINTAKPVKMMGETL